ncbi:efflux RND transporter periplasmic adaptor subunit [Fulvivirga sedimenti]|uniref:Efflux RND transporter periplasmic adaptor subunit n=1 Tax=Fulvivirga sedimenti TaxID=2879465 RepID=A0A9X1KYX3_9BACT|nr:efflux RND transporter periplasmic adaptor subunit [Fulvivirga sedimenti]MCA6075310.1 efflux RND transporter periplasmic adaptor subunit [Fulvivirga sedimenti]MCA6076487.1 efflux RND transporter periplasmic adaptor subunit [Fulvivirga sedimenti]MCA6077615.1 efflux RND transporter periplasmic adaptor subunit [Fulvivirga sedimenti]
MKKRYWIYIIVAIAAIALTYILTQGGETSERDILVTAKRGDFTVEITTSGELEARNSVNILGPSGLRSVGIWRVEIRDIVDEGTKVKKGDYVAQLDQTEILSRTESSDIEVQQSISEYTQVQLDTALELRRARDELINLKFAVEEKEIILSQSQYEPPATIKQAEINVEKAQRAYRQALENYKLTKRKAAARMSEAAADLREDQMELDRLKALLSQFRITAPEDGMVTYKRGRNGQKQGVGATVEPWDPTVATLPDLGRMMSRTFVNEIDIRSVQKGQTVKIGLDAYPEKELTGVVIDVANIGEQRPNSDAKVFMVNIEVNETDTTLRPSMTTSNTILADRIPDVVFVPLECLHNQGDSLTYVIRKNGLTYSRQQVLVGKTNANEAVILDGVSEGDELYLSIPPDVEDTPLALLTDVPENVAVKEEN